MFILNYHLTNLSLESNILYVASVFIDTFPKAFLNVCLHSLSIALSVWATSNLNCFFQFLQCTRLMLIHMSLEISAQEIITNGQIRWLRGQVVSANQEMRQSPKRKWSTSIKDPAVWVVTPSCWNLTRLIGTCFRRNSGTKKLLIISV